MVESLKFAKQNLLKVHLLSRDLFLNEFATYCRFYGTAAPEIKGRRGFDILRALQNNPAIEVEITEEEVPHLPEVDAKLVHLAQKLDATIVTNDLNLNKVAELQSVKVLNINELSNAVSSCCDCRRGDSSTAS